MPSSFSMKFITVKSWRGKNVISSRPSRTLSILCRGERIGREDLFKYTNGRFLVKEKEACDRRYLNFDLDQLCAIAASTGTKSAIQAVEKMEGGFSKSLLMIKEDGTEVIAKLPFSIAGPTKYLTASEAAVLKYLHDHTEVPAPKILAWNADSSNPVGAEYIIMEKAPGCQLVKKWGEMEDYSHIIFIKNLCRIEAELAAIALPANGSLYLRESMKDCDKHEPLAPEMDPFGRFCIGPSCERAWFGDGEAESVQARFDRGPWLTLSAFGVAIAEREITRIKQNPKAAVSYGPPRGSVQEQLTVLEMAKVVFSRMDPQSLPGCLECPTLWHTDLHMGNIYVSDKDPTQIVSLIDWKSIVASPLFYQVRFPAVVRIDENYELGTEVPTLPHNINQIDADDEEIARFKHKQIMMGKTYEAASGLKNKNIYKALQMNPFFRQLFVRCGKAWEDGVVPLRACLIAIAETWDESGLSGDCPLKFNKDDIAKHQQDFEEYRDYHKIHELAREYLDTDEDGWIAPDDDFEMKQQRNKELLGLLIAHCAEYGKSAGEMRNIWPY